MKNPNNSVFEYLFYAAVAAFPLTQHYLLINRFAGDGRMTPGLGGRVMAQSRSIRREWL
jgi:hypothetical protein